MGKDAELLCHNLFDDDDEDADPSQQHPKELLFIRHVEVAGQLEEFQRFAALSNFDVRR